MKNMKTHSSNFCVDMHVIDYAREPNQEYQKSILETDLMIISICMYVYIYILLITVESESKQQ